MILMAIRYFFYACCCIILGCGGSKIERTVQDDNIFYSSNKPTIRIKISPDFTFEVEKDQNDSGSYELSGETTTNVKIKNYFFRDRISGKPKMVIITIKELTRPKWFFKSKIFNVKNEFDSGSIKIHGKTYQYCTFAVAKPNNEFLVKAIGKIFGAENNCMIVIQYFEQVTGEWSNINILTAEQQRQLREFIEDSKRDIQILE